VNSKDVASALARGKRDPRASIWVGFAEAIEEIKDGLKIHPAAAEMVLCGLVAVADVRMQNAQRRLIEPGTCALGELREGAKAPAFISADDLHHHLAEWSALPPIGRDAEIKRRLREREKPGKAFYKGVRDACGGWIKTGGEVKAARGFSDKQIQRVYKALRDE
jgi:hypothetical protein